jgi:hypothetical protein
MQKIIASRGTGKTKQLMYEAYHNNGIFVCQNVNHMREKANAYGFTGLNMISFYDFINNIHDYPLSWTETTVRGYKDPEGKQFYIDEIEGFVQHICLNNLAGYTLSLE